MGKNRIMLQVEQEDTLFNYLRQLSTVGTITQFIILSLRKEYLKVKKI